MLPIIGEKAPPGRLLPVKGGNAVAFPADFAGRAVMMSFFSTTWGPCVNEVLQLQPHLKGWSDRGFDVIFVGAQNQAVLESFIEQRKVTMNAFHDSGREMHRVYGVTGIPATFIIDHKGVLRHHKVGWGQATLQEVTGWVDKLCPPK
jgi:cytochrome c biogenesis protein CcmG, thiol:disulfide interchange protein DsbE